MVLIVDEWNSLLQLTAESSTEDSKFGQFIKKNFLAKEGRYFVFSSLVLSTLNDSGPAMDPTNGSVRDVILQELALVDNFFTAVESLYAKLDGAREAIYYGILPGILYEQSRGKFIAGKRERVVCKYNDDKKSIGDKDREFKTILRSLYSGNVDDFPKQLHLLLDGCGAHGDKMIRRVPFNLEYVLEHTKFSNECELLSKSMAKLCKSMKDADEASGKAWEALFVLYLVARCINHSYADYFVPKHWFNHPSVKVKFNPYYKPARPFGQCQTWNELKEGIGASETFPIVSVFYLSHATFIVFYVIAVYSTPGNAYTQVYGYQLKEGKANDPKKFTDTTEAFTRSFVVKGNPPGESQDKNSWNTP